MNQMIHFAHLDDESLPIAAVEHNGRIAFANSALEALLGVPRKQIEGEWQLVHANAVAQPATDQNEVNKELLRNLAHEIKNPLGGIRGAAQLLQMDMTDKSLIEYTQVIIHEADRLQSLVDRLLAPHRQPHVLGVVNVHEICERVRQLILVEFPQGLTVVRDYDASIPEFQGDREQLIQALLNIAHNAAQALEDRIADGSATLTFKTRIARQVVLGNTSSKTRHKLALQLHVIDNGPGVPDEIKDRIFYPLVTGRAGGSGLGLSLAQNFVQQHGGVIECESSPGRTDFSIVMPLAV
jgi:two-component system nitrogen regulation sensor histidine kinase GlnL